MNAPSPARINSDPNSTVPKVKYGRSREGFLAARVAEAAFSMLPARDGRHYLATGWRIGRPIAQWMRSDFYGHSGELADESAFRAKIAENAEHQRERKVLGRRDISSTASTPWGASQGATVYAGGVFSHSTAGHGGFHLNAAHNAKVHSMLRARGGWYESHD